MLVAKLLCTKIKMINEKVCMKKKSKTIVYSIITLILMVTVSILILTFSNNNTKSKYDYLVRDHLQTIASLDSEFDIHNVVIYWTEDGRAYIH